MGDDSRSCCAWPQTSHWDASQQASLTPGTRVAVDGKKFTVTGRDHDPLGYERVTLSPEPDRRWWLQFAECGAAHYQFQGDWNTVGGGMGGVDELIIISGQGVLI